jgi:hypothetical protein
MQVIFLEIFVERGNIFTERYLEVSAGEKQVLKMC